MNENRMAYYVAAGKSLDAINEYIERRKAGNVKHCDFAKLHGAEEFQVVDGFCGSRRFVGIYRDGDVPAGWKRHKSGKSLVPDTRTKRGKDIARQMESLSIGSIKGDIGGDFMDGGRLHTPGYQKLGDRFIISLHAKAAQPADGIPMKHSEFWSLKEAEDASKMEVAQ